MVLEKMNFLLILLLVITHQNIANDDEENYSELDKLINYADVQLKEVKLYAGKLMDNVAKQLKEVMQDMRRESLSYINEGIEKLQQLSNDDSSEETDTLETITNKLHGCSEGLNTTSEATITQFIGIVDEAEAIVDSLVKKLDKEPGSWDEDEINDEVDDLFGDFKETFEETIIPQLEGILRQTRTHALSMPSNVKGCVDDVLSYKIKD